MKPNQFFYFLLTMAFSVAFVTVAFSVALVTVALSVAFVTAALSVAFVRSCDFNGLSVCTLDQVRVLVKLLY